MLKFFAEKIWVVFAVHIFSAKNIRILYIESNKIVNQMTLNELVKLKTQLGPEINGFYFIFFPKMSSIYAVIYKTVWQISEWCVLWCGGHLWTISFTFLSNWSTLCTVLCTHSSVGCPWSQVQQCNVWCLTFLYQEQVRVV